MTSLTKVREVVVQSSENLDDNGLGMFAGGVGGALAGNMCGKGKGNAVTTIGGAIIGATAGAFAEKSLKTQNAYEYIVKLDSGDMMTVVQGKGHMYQPNKQVYVIVGQKGRSRIIDR